VQQRLGQGTIIGQQHQSLGVAIQAPDREEPRALAREQVHHRRTAFGIAHGRQHAGGLVCHPVDERLGGDPLSVQRHLVASGICAVAQTRHPAVDRNAALAQVLLGGAAGGDARGGQDLLEPDRLPLRQRLLALRRPA
jgi:hypothetical protein